MDRNWMPTTIGVLNIISGVCAGLGGVILVATGTFLRFIPEIADEPDAEIPLFLASGFVWLIALCALITAVLALAGGVAALRRTSWTWALAGSVAAFFAIAPLGLAAILLTILAEPELRGDASP